MQSSSSTTTQSADLFETAPPARCEPAVKRSLPLELRVAGALCRQIRRRQAPRDKQRIAHLICLNLLSMLRHSR